MGLCNVPVGPSHISPGLLEQAPQHNFSTFHRPSITGHQQETAQARWRSTPDQFPSRESDFRDSGLLHCHSGSSDFRRTYRDADNARMRRDRHGLSGIQPGSVNNETHITGRRDTLNPPEDTNEMVPLFRRDTKPRGGQEFTERHRTTSGRRSRDRDYNGDRERQKEGLDRETYGSGHHRSRLHSPETERINYLGQSSPNVHRRWPDHCIARDSRGTDLDRFEHRSHLPLPHQSHGYHSPPPLHDNQPPERRPRLDEDPYAVKERLELPPPDYSNPFLNSERFPPPSHSSLADRLGETPGTMAHSIQARLGPPRITEPLDRNQGIVPFNTGPPHHLHKSEAHSHGYPLPDLRQALGGHNAMPPQLMESSFPQTVSPYNSAPGHRGMSPPFRPPPASVRHVSPSPRKDEHLISPVRGPPRRTLSPPGYLPSPPRRPASPVRHPPPPVQRPPSPPKRPPSPAEHPQASPKYLLPPGEDSPSHTRSPAKAKTSTVKDVSACSRQPQSPAAKPKSPLRHKTTEEKPHTKHSSGPTSPPRSRVRSKGHGSPPKRTRHSSGQPTSSASDTGTSRSISVFMCMGNCVYP